MQTMTHSESRRVIWGLSLHGWEEMMRWSLAAAGIAALIVGVSTYFVVTLQREEIAASRNEFERYKIDAAKEVQSVRSDSDTKIRVASEQAGAEIAKANARSNEANAKALEAQLALAVFRQDRKLSDSQKSDISALLRKFAGTKFDGAVANNEPDMINLWVQIDAVLKAAGYGQASIGGHLPE
jgi:hypothetical protein